MVRSPRHFNNILTNFKKRNAMTQCPGCPLENMPYQEQLALKKERLERALNAYPRLAELDIPSVLASPEREGYRNRARMVLNPRAKSAADLLGFYAEGSRRVVAVERCAAHHPQLEDVLDALRPLLFLSPALRRFTRFVDVRVSAGYGVDPPGEQAVVTLAGEAEAIEQRAALDAEAAQLFEELSRRLKALEIGAQLNISQSKNQSILSGEQHPIAGLQALKIKLGAGAEAPAVDQPVLSVSPEAFFQVNLEQLARVHQQMRASLMPGAALIDLYCGVGTHGVALAHRAGAEPSQLIGFDLSDEAINRARENAKSAGVSAQFLSADARDAAPWMREKLAQMRQARGDLALAAITNPARAGMSAEALLALSELAITQLFYLSCEPQTLARDLDRLLELGFRVESIQAYDFMPQTDQVETLAILKRDPSTAAISALERERAFWPQRERSFSLGVSGPGGFNAAERRGAILESRWIALVAGESPKQGFLPQLRPQSERRAKKDRAKNSAASEQRVRVERLRKVEGNSVLKIYAGAIDDVELRRRLRAWGHPVLGDQRFGDRQANYMLERHGYLDRLALHAAGFRTEAGWQKAETPGQFLALMRLGRALLDL